MNLNSNLSTARRRLLAAAIAQSLVCGAQAANISVTTVQDVVAVDGECSLREAIHNANSEDVGDMHSDCNRGDASPAVGLTGGEDVVQLRPPNQPIELTLGELEISSNVVIQGPLGSPPDRIISGGLLSRIFHVTAERTVGIENLMLIRGKADNGGALRVGSVGADVTLDNCVLRTNTATSSGGAIAQQPGTFQSLSKLTLTNSTVESNSAGFRGGGIAQINPFLSDDGARLSLSNVMISGNQSRSGGGLFLYDTAEIADTVIDGNTASNAGGGLIAFDYLSPSVPAVTITDSIISGNSAPSGGGIANRTSLSLLRTEICDNQADSGGGIHTTDDAALTDVTVCRNSASYGGGGILNDDDASVSISGSSIYENIAVSRGGAIANFGPLSVTNTSITSNATGPNGDGESGRGGGIFDSTRSATIVGGLIAENRSSAGGGVYTWGDMSVSGTDIIQNVSTGDGAGLLVTTISANVASVAIVDSTISGNSASSQGGGLYAASSTMVSVTDSILSENYADSGGGIWSYADLVVQGATVSNNFVGEDAGGIGSRYRLQLENSTVSGNSADDYAGVFATGAVTILNATIVDNESPYGIGGLALAAPTAILANSVIAGNTGGDCYTSSPINWPDNHIEDGSCLPTGSTRVGDPLLGPLTDGLGLTPVHPIRSGSPLVDAGLESACDDVSVDDQTGLPRSIDGNADGNEVCDFGAVEFIDVYPPTFTAALPDAIPRGDELYEILVKWRDVDGRVDRDSLGDGDIVAMGPNGFTAPLTLSFSTSNMSGSEINAVYALAPPGGTWGAEDSGEYEMRVVEDEVFDLATTGANAALVMRVATSQLRFPEIDVTGNGQTIQDGDATPDAGDQTDFGDVVVGASRIRSFQVLNVGTRELELQSINVGGVGFSRVDNPVGILQPSESATLRVRFQSQAESVSTGFVTIQSDDYDEAVYDFAVAGRGIVAPAAEIAVSGNGIEIDDGDVTPAESDGTDFGFVQPGETVEQSFTITNQGSGTLALGGNVAVTGSGFRVSQQPTQSSLPAGQNTEFSVAFEPVDVGVFNGVISLASNDSDEDPYNFAIVGLSSSNRAPVVEDATFETSDAAISGDAVGQVVAVDPDNNIPTTGAYAITAGGEPDRLEINDMGLIYIGSDSPRETEYVLTVTVTDAEGLSGEGTITILVDQADLLFREGFEAPDLP